MEIKRVGSQPSSRGSADYFTGAVRLDPLFQAPDPALVSGGNVTFEPGAPHRLAYASIVMGLWPGHAQSCCLPRQVPFVERYLRAKAAPRHIWNRMENALAHAA